MKSTRTKKMKLVKKLSKKASKKVTKKAIKKGGAFGTKRPREENLSNRNSNNTNIGGEIDRSEIFNDMLNTIGDETLLYKFAEFLGRPGANFIQCPIDPIDGKPVKSLEWIAYKREHLTNEFSGLVFDGAHWIGYEPVIRRGLKRVEYNSYPRNLQLGGTNNFCQSYATYLWARRGELTYSDHGIEINFIPGNYTHNIREMAKLWLAWIDNMRSSNDGENLIKYSIQDGINEGAVSEGYDIEKLRSMFEEISENDEVARDLSQSKE